MNALERLAAKMNANGTIGQTTNHVEMIRVTYTDRTGRHTVEIAQTYFPVWTMRNPTANVLAVEMITEPKADWLWP